jgi:predicted RNA-binding Zn ribbon-like protein
MTASSPRAPAPLETVRAFVNTLDVEDSVDSLATPADLTVWLLGSALVGPGVRATDADLARALSLREALRSALAANHDDSPVPAAAVATLGEMVERGDLALSMTADGAWIARPRTTGVDGGLGALLVIVANAMTDGSWRRLKVCANDACQWAFYDSSRARSGKWCSMQVCGNRAKQQAWRTRHEA